LISCGYPRSENHARSTYFEIAREAAAQKDSWTGPWFTPDAGVAFDLSKFSKSANREEPQSQSERLHPAVFVFFSVLRVFEREEEKNKSSSWSFWNGPVQLKK